MKLPYSIDTWIELSDELREVSGYMLDMSKRFDHVVNQLQSKDIPIDRLGYEHRQVLISSWEIANAAIMQSKSLRRFAQIRNLDAAESCANEAKQRFMDWLEE